jgi:predicted alpha/beta superfamily hydrolase
MNKVLLVFFLSVIFTTASIQAQVTLRVTSIPSNTPLNATIYMAGSLNQWNPGDANYTLQADGSGNRIIVIPEGTGTVEYKFTRGSWPSVEGNATGGFLPNRTFTFTGSPQTINLTIQSWEDLGSTQGSTAASNVQILSPNFFMPQLNRSRRIWIYLPPDYYTSTKNYPVLYMHDGQNLFDQATSFSGEWQVDETLNALFAQGDYGAIVVGIDNGGAERLNEYSPWVNPQYGGGQGAAYMAFVAETLKPHIDANFRTRPEPAMNALIGSSMGALISTYGICAYPNQFRKAGSLSPAYWFALNQFTSYIGGLSASLQNHRVYFVAGQNESASMIPNMISVRDQMMAKGLASSNTLTKADSYGTHTEGYWRGEFAALYQWLFAGENLSAVTVQTTSAQLIAIDSGRVYAQGLSEKVRIKVINTSGKIVAETYLMNGIADPAANLPSGVYILKPISSGLKPIRIIKP